MGTKAKKNKKVTHATYNKKEFLAPFRKLSKNKLIFDTERTKKSENPQAHQRPLRLWISLEYRLKQQSNASKSNHTIDMFLD